MTAKPILEVKDLSCHFVVRRDLLGRPKAKVQAVDNVSLTLMPGETLAVVGESGCGKSTLGRMMMRLIEPTTGRVFLDGEDITALNHQELRARRRHVQLIFQDPYASLNPRMTIAETIAEPLKLYNILPASKRRARVHELLKLVGLRPEQANRYPNEFSGGQRQRVVIARALASEPKVIVCDEAVSALDVSIQSQILNLLKDLQARLGLAFIFISHDLSVVKHISDRIAVMYLGKLVELGTSEQIFAHPRHPYTRALLSSIPVAAARTVRPPASERLDGDLPSPIAPPSGCRLHTRCPHAREDCKSVPMVLEAGEDGHANACPFWRDLPVADLGLSGRESHDPRLEALFAAFETFADEGRATP